jgi:hypothetical protein
MVSALARYFGTKWHGYGRSALEADYQLHAIALELETAS